MNTRTSALPPSTGTARLLFSYLNPCLAMGLQPLVQAMHEAAVGAALLTDLIPEQATSWRKVAAASGVETCFLAAITDRKSTRLNSSHCTPSRMPSSA